MKTLDSVDHVDTKRFMGAWFVLAHIPPFFTADAFNSVERYQLKEDGTVDVLFTHNEGGFEGELKTVTPTGFPDQSDDDGIWTMRFFWPFKHDYRIAYLNADYSHTIIARNARDYVWIMAGTPSISDQEYDDLVNRVAAMGYDISKLRKVPQQPLDQRSTPETAEEF